MEKFTQIWTSELCWDIYGLNKDDPDNLTFPSIPYIIHPHDSALFSIVANGREIHKYLGHLVS